MRPYTLLLLASVATWTVPMGLQGATTPPPERLVVETREEPAAVAAGAAGHAAIVGPRKLVFTLPATGRCQAVTGGLGPSGAPWSIAWGTERAPAVRLLLSSADPAGAAIDVSLAMAGQGEWKTKYFIRPNLAFYPSAERAREFCLRLSPRAAFAERQQLEDKYHLLRSATEHHFTIRMERLEAGLSIWLDGRFLAAVPAETLVPEGVVSLAGGGELIEAVDLPAVESRGYVPLCLAGYARPGSLRFAGEIAGMMPGRLANIDGVPLLPLCAAENIDVGLSRWLEEAIDPPDFVERDTTRSALDGNPESIILQVPKANYVAAHVLCAVDEDTAKSPVLSLRVTRFGNHYGDSGGRGAEALADTSVRLPQGVAAGDGEPAGRAKKVGEIRANVVRRSGWRQVTKEETLPVLLVRVPLPIGEIADLLGEDSAAFGRRRDYFDIELTKEIRTAVQFFNLQNCRRKPLGLPSAVHVFGITLEKSPVDVQLTSAAPGNVFCAGEEAALDVRLTNHADAAARMTVLWQTRDYYGRETSQSTVVSLPSRVAGGTAHTRIALVQPVLGHFDATLTVKDDAWREFWRQPTSFALLPKDTRTAGDESPFGVWWFVGSHGCCDRLEWMGPILKKMGMRHCCPGPFSEEELKPYQLSYSMVPWYGKQREAFIAKHPHVRFGMIFHETAAPNTPQPYEELLGRPKPETSKEADPRLRQLWDQAIEAGKWYRQQHPQIKLTLGNSPSAVAVWMMRQGFPRQYIDCFGMEGVAGWATTECQPKRGVMQEVWWLVEMRKRYGYGDVPVSSGFEYICRCTQPGGLSEQEQADLYVRDALHCLAYGYPSINIGLADDCADSYYSTIYGASGFLHRHPLLTPKRSCVAWATMTSVLDGARYERYVDTGSNSLYVLEFSGRGKRIYPLWTVRGKRQLRLEVSAAAELIDCMGNSRELSAAAGAVNFEAVTAPAYLVTSGKVEKVVAGQSRFEESLPANAVAVAELADPAAWEVETTPDRALETNADDEPMALGRFTLSAVRDAEQGSVLECTMGEQSQVSSLLPRYVSLRRKQPVALAGEVRRLGMWIKGNSCWGRIYWEFQDAGGQRFFSAANETSGWNVSDWRDRTAVNFDGWNFVSLDIPKRYPGGYHMPTDRDWSYQGGEGDGVVRHPITLTRVVVALRSSQVYLTDLVPARSRSIRLGSIIAGD